MAQGTPSQVLTPEVLRRLYGAEMVVVNQGDMILVGDAFGAMVDPHDRETHAVGTPAAHFGEVPAHDHGPGTDHEHQDVESR